VTRGTAADATSGPPMTSKVHDVGVRAGSTTPEASPAPELSPGLVARASRGDQAAFSALVEHYQHEVYTAAYLLLGNAQDAEDAAQEAFLRAYRGLARYRGEAAFGTWLFRVAVRAAADQRRRRWRMRREEELGGAGPALPPVLDASPEQRAQVRLLLEAMAALPPARRKPLVLREVYGYQYAEMASLLGKPIGTVKAAVHRGRLAVKEALERRGVLEAEDE